MSDLSFGIEIGAALDSTLGKTLSTFDKKVEATRQKAAKAQIGKTWADNIINVKKRMKAVESLQNRLGRSRKLTERWHELNSELASVKTQAKQFGVTVDNAATKSVKLGKAIKQASNEQKRLFKLASNKEYRKELQGRIFKTVALGAAFIIPTKAAINFESTMADVRKVVNFETPKQFEEMGKGILELTTEKKLPLAASQIGDIIAAAGQAGIARKELLTFGEDAAKMAIAFDMEGKEAGSTMTGLRSIYKLNQKEVVTLGDSINHLSNNMDATARDIVKITNRAGSMAQMFGLSGQQTSALAATFLELKTPPEVAGTAMNAMFLKMKTADTQGKKFQNALHSIGWTATELKTAIKDDAQGALLEFLKTVKNAKDPMNTLSELFGMEYSDDVTKIVSNLDKYEEALDNVGKETKYLGSMQGEYDARSKTTANNLVILKNRFNRLSIKIGSALLPTLNSLADTFGTVTEWISVFAEKHPGLTKVVIGATVAFVGLRLAILTTKYASSHIIDTFGILKSGFTKISLGASLAKIKIIAFSGTQKIMAAGSAIYSSAMGLMSGATAAFGAVLMATPIGWIIGGIAAIIGAGVLLYKYWTPISNYFLGFWDGLKTAVKPAFSAIIDAFKPLKPLFSPVIDGLQTIFGWFGNILSPVKEGGEEAKGFGMTVGTVLGKVIGILINFNPVVLMFKAFSKVISFFRSIDWSQSGSQIIGTLIDGIKRKAGELVNNVKDVFGKVRKLLPFSDAKEGPFSDLTLSGSRIISTLGEGVKTGRNDFRKTLSDTLQSAKPAVSFESSASVQMKSAESSAQSAGNSIHIDNINVYTANGDEAELENKIRNIFNNLMNGNGDFADAYGA